MPQIKPLPQFPGYTTLKLIGEGGSAFVYLGWQASLNRHVAIKVFKPEYSLKPDFTEKLKSELLGLHLNHPNIIVIYDAGECDKQFYVIMEYAEEGSLEKRLNETNALSEKEILFIIESIAKALDYLSDQGLVHSDIKPENILFRKNGIPILVDFGVSSLLEQGIERSSKNTVLGSPYYVSPDVLRHDTLDVRSDLYSLGIIFYEMLTGKKPFDHADAFQLGMMHINKPLPNLPTAYVRYSSILGHLTEKKSSARFGSGEELCEALNELTNDRVKKPNKTIQGFLAISLFLSIIGIAYYLFEQSAHNVEITIPVGNLAENNAPSESVEILETSIDTKKQESRVRGVSQLDIAPKKQQFSKQLTPDNKVLSKPQEINPKTPVKKKPIVPKTITTKITGPIKPDVVRKKLFETDFYSIDDYADFFLGELPNRQVAIAPAKFLGYANIPQEFAYLHSNLVKKMGEMYNPWSSVLLNSDLSLENVSLKISSVLFQDNERVLKTFEKRMKWPADYNQSEFIEIRLVDEESYSKNQNIEFATNKVFNPSYYLENERIHLYLAANVPVNYFIIVHAFRDDDQYSYLIPFNKGKFVKSLAADKVKLRQELGSFLVEPPFGVDVLHLVNSEEILEKVIPKTAWDAEKKVYKLENMAPGIENPIQRVQNAIAKLSGQKIYEDFLYITSWPAKNGK